MSILTLILGESGTGKTSSLRNLDPAQTLLIQAVPKPLPFRSTGWRVHSKAAPGNIIRTDDADKICAVLANSKAPVVIVDDWQYILANEFMRRTNETGFQKFTDIGKAAWNVLTTAASCGDKRVYLLAHTDTADDGRVKVKTIGKLLDEKICVEGLVTICLRTAVRDGRYYFSTRNSGNDTVKSPIGLFADHYIDNDLATVDSAIAAYYSDDPLTADLGDLTAAAA